MEDPGKSSHAAAEAAQRAEQEREIEAARKRTQRRSERDETRERLLSTTGAVAEAEDEAAAPVPPTAGPSAPWTEPPERPTKRPRLASPERDDHEVVSLRSDANHASPGAPSTGGPSTVVPWGTPSGGRVGSACDMPESASTTCSPNRCPETGLGGFVVDDDVIVCSGDSEMEMERKEKEEKERRKKERTVKHQKKPSFDLKHGRDRQDSTSDRSIMVVDLVDEDEVDQPGDVDLKQSTSGGSEGPSTSQQLNHEEEKAKMFEKRVMEQAGKQSLDSTDSEGSIMVVDLVDEDEVDQPGDVDLKQSTSGGSEGPSTSQQLNHEEEKAKMFEKRVMEQAGKQSLDSTDSEGPAKESAHCSTSSGHSRMTVTPDDVVESEGFDCDSD